MVCRSLCHYGLFGLSEGRCMYGVGVGVCVSGCVLGGGRGRQGTEAWPVCLVKSIVAFLSPYCCRWWTQSEPTHTLRLHPQIPSPEQQRDYGRNRLIYFCEFTKYLHTSPGINLILESKKKAFCFFFIFHHPKLQFSLFYGVQSQERKRCISNLRAFVCLVFLFWGYIGEGTLGL